MLFRTNEIFDHIHGRADLSSVWGILCFTTDTTLIFYASNERSNSTIGRCEISELKYKTLRYPRSVSENKGVSTLLLITRFSQTTTFSYFME